MVEFAVMKMIFRTVLISLPFAVQAQVMEVSSVFDAAGGRSTGGGYTHLSASGQPGGVEVSKNGALVNFAGFLNTFSLQGDLDTDGDGLADEVDADNDGDMLDDDVELAGSGFDPPTGTLVNNPDSDGDGVDDGGESVAGTDPTDANANLRIIDIHRTGGNVTIAYLARGGPSAGKTYHIQAHNDAGSILGAPVDTNTTPAGGTAPWYVVTNTFTEIESENRFFAVEALP